MPALLLEPVFIGIAAVIGVGIAAGTYEAGQAAGQGIGTAVTIVGIGAAVGLVLFALHKK